MKNEFVIRDYKHNDFPEIFDLWLETGLATPKRGDDESVIKKTLINGGRFLVLENTQNGKIAGTSWMTVDARRTYLHHFGISPEYQGKGLSKILMDETMEIAKKIGYQTKIEVHQTNKVALNLYKKYGFKYLGDYDVFIIREMDEL